MKDFSLPNNGYLYIIVCLLFPASCTPKDGNFDEDFLRRIETQFVKDASASLPENLKHHPETLSIVRKESIRLSICDLSFLETQPDDIKNMYISVALSIEYSNGHHDLPKMIADAFLLKLKNDEWYHDASYGKKFFWEKLEFMGK